MLGIPPTNTPDFVTFKISFFAGLYSGVIYSILTGLLVGIAMLLVQLYVESRKEKKIHKKEIYLLREKLKYINFQNHTKIIQSAKTSCPPPVLEIIKITNELPIYFWRTDTKNDTDFIQKIKELKLKYLQFVKSSEQLDLSLSQFVRRYNAARGAIEANDPAGHSYLVGRIFKFNPEQIIPWLDSGNPTDLEQCYIKVTQDMSILNLTEPFLRNRKELEEDIHILEVSLNS